MIIWGYRTKVFVLAMLTLVCGQCGNPAAHALRKNVTKFTLFFIPLFPIGVKHSIQCAFCGVTNRLTKEQAQQLLAQHQPVHPQQPVGQQQPHR
ncbi:zinc-ribbon domain-containing protein [Actinosynnema sp. NPDC020468]|uniref:zinc-ribbon domain-containing protein n=1 Tax=Actinosynnema sp. NPDC020468 TaxID=3154488 RepID=UPI0033EA62DF